MPRLVTRSSRPSSSASLISIRGWSVFRVSTKRAVSFLGAIFAPPGTEGVPYVHGLFRTTLGAIGLRPTPNMIDSARFYWLDQCGTRLGTIVENTLPT